LAGGVAALVSVLAGAVFAPLSLASSGGAEAILQQLPPESLAQLQQVGIDPNMLFSGGTMIGISLCCALPFGLLIGAILGALGGVIFAAIKPE
jgi:cobalamin synthase